MPKSEFIVLRIVGWSDFNSAGTEILIYDRIIRNDRNASFDKWVGCKFAVKVLYVSLSDERRDDNEEGTKYT
jgi:hypothetical protein